MAEAAVTLLQPAVEKLVNSVSERIKRQFNYLCCFTGNIDDLRKEAKELDAAVAGLEQEIEIKRDDLEDPINVEPWLTDSKEIQLEISRILNEAANVGSGCCSKLGARSLSRTAKKTTESTKVHRDGKPTAQFLPRPNAATQEVELGNTFECESRNEIEEAIMKTLTGGDKNMIGICGMGGLGKTTMATKIMNKALKENIFKEVVIVTFSQKVDISTIQDKIGGQLGLKKLKDETSESGRAQLLLSRLSDEKRTTLLVLDDVWGRPALKRIGIPRDSKWCKIIFTSRNSDVLHKMGVQIFGMKVLSKEEAWSFFRERAGSCVDDRELNPIAEEVAKECGGLPINLAAVAAMLKDKPIQGIWRGLLRKLKKSVPDNVEYDEENYNPLKLSYEYLDSKEAQSIFLLCGLFPEDADIPLDYLTYFSMALGIFEDDDITSMEHARDLMCEKTEFLKDRSLLLESDLEDCVRMHDVVRDVCIFIAKEKGYIGKDDCPWISSSHLVGEGNLLLSGSSSPKLNLLFLDWYDNSSRFKFDDAFLEGMRELRVLCIENYSSLTTLSLGKLHTLILDSCNNLETISVGGELANLEILICRSCRLIERLPSEMKVLNCLKVLDLTDSWELKIGRGIIASLVGLEELKMRGSFCSWEGEDGEEGENAGAQLRELEKLTKLACLEIDILDSSLLAENMPRLSSKIVRFIIRTQFHDIPSEFTKAMKLYNLEGESRLGDWIAMQLLRDTEYLELHRNGANNVNLAKNKNIRWLEVSECESMKNIATTSGGDDDATVFPSLEHMELESLPKLQEICDGPMSSTSFQNLKELKLRGLRALTQFWKSSNCVPHFSNLSSIDIEERHSLRNLGQLSMAGKGYLPQLEKLNIQECEMMEQVFLLSNEEAIESQRKCQVITKVFPKLKSVKLDSLPNLVTFYQGIEGIEFPLLMEMIIEKCPKMNRIVGGSSAGIDDDASLHVLCQPTKVSFGSLEVLTLDDVGSMSVFTLSVAANLLSLIRLSISKCQKMIKVIEDEEQQERILLFPKLEELYLTDLPKLVSFCDSKCDVEFPVLEDVEIKRCPNMESFSMGIRKATPNLEALRADLSTYVGVGVDVAFDSLKQLMITKNENPLYGNKISVSLFNGLETLIFYECKGGMGLFSSSTVRNLVNLRKLEIIECDGMLVNIIEEEEEEEEVVSGGAVFPKLEVLKLSSLPNLVSFSEWKCDVELLSLTQVKIEKCPNMENFSMGSVVAPNLKTVKIGYEYIDATKDLNGALHQHYLDRRPQRKVLFKVEIAYNPFYGQKLHSSIFTRLGNLRINWYVGSMSLFTLSVAANLVNLRKLSIQNCGEMIRMIEDEQQQQRNILLFPKLEELYLQELSKLVAFCDCKCEVELPSLKKVVIMDCPNMENLSMGLLATPKLEAFTTDLSTYVGVGVDVAFTSLKELLISQIENPWSDDKISVSLLNRLQKLEFFVCKGSMSLFSSSAVGNLVNLKELRIRRCDELVKVIEDREEEEEEDRKVVSGGEIMTLLLFPKLEELYLSELPNLVSVCEWKCDVELPSLTKVEIFKCRNIKYFSMGSVVAPYMEIVHI